MEREEPMDLGSFTTLKKGDLAMTVLYVCDDCGFISTLRSEFVVNKDSTLCIECATTN